ncbi:Sugar transporter ERD6-like 15 [Linum perenne]
MCILSCNISSLLVTLSFQSLLQWSFSGTFLIYAGVSAVAFVFVAKLVPETKGRTLEEIQSSFTYR